ncbi:salivary C-type lectin 2-like [Babylonia areolata]|uniref:salivary C-type lectin 2-like n=1 Tax=Babylonia areolata TaxID=304850 RepID=UPI003FD2DAFF
MIRRSFHVLVFTLVAVTVVYGQCRDGWTFDSWRGSCYAIPTGAEGNWAEAMGYCAAMSSELAVVESQGEHDFLVSLIKNMTGFSHDKDFWIGAVDILEEGVFIWANRLTRIEQYFWGQGEPDNANGRQSCLRMEHELQWQWGDGNCQSTEYFVCEREPEG